ncbi:MAG: hypothetical protein HRU09_17205 [Oligoflexales bacterium]|nr:hypothetical protein [Oligoflexales bacterium]
MRLFIGILEIFILLNLVTCKTRSSTSSDLKATVQSGDQLVFSSTESQYFYETLSRLEKKIGIESSKKGLRELNGLVHCNQNSGYKNCYILVKNLPRVIDGMTLNKVKTDIEKNFLVEKTKLIDTVSRKIWDHIIETQANIRFEPDVVADLKCSFISSNIPSFAPEKTDCSVYFPRLPNQAMFADDEAKTIADLLQGNEAYQHSNGIVNGQINCQWKNDEAQCVVSRIGSEKKNQNFNLLGKDESLFVYSRLIYVQRYVLPTNKSFNPKTVIFSPINCRVDLSSLRENGTYTANCSVTFTENAGGRVTPNKCPTH